MKAEIKPLGQEKQNKDLLLTFKTKAKENVQGKLKLNI